MGLPEVESDGDDDELKRLFEALREDSVAIRQENAAAHTGTRRHFDVATEATRYEIGLIAEKVTQLDERLDRTAGRDAILTYRRACTIAAL